MVRLCHATPGGAAVRGLTKLASPAPAPAAAPRAPSALGLFLGGIVAAEHGASAICHMLGLSLECLLAQVVALGLPTPADKPLRKAGSRNPWTPAQVQQLIVLWPTNLYATAIADRIGRSAASVRYKARWLGLPSRERASLVRDVPDGALLPLLPPPPPAAPAPVKHRGGRKKLALRVGEDREYEYVDYHEAGLRWFAGQHSVGIARDLGRRYSQTVNMCDRIELPPRHHSRNQLTMDYDPNRRLEAFAGQQFVLRQCLVGGNWFWSTKNGPRISKAARKTQDKGVERPQQRDRRGGGGQRLTAGPPAFRTPRRHGPLARQAADPRPPCRNQRRSRPANGLAGF